MGNSILQADSVQPENEKTRLQEVNSYNILDTIPEQEYDDIAMLSAQICHTPASTVAILDENRKWHKAKHGLDKDSVPRSFSICSHTILGDDLLIVEDTHQHNIFKNIGMVTNPPFVRFYAGVPLVNSEGYALGTLCVIDTKPNSINDYQKSALKALARQTVALLELRKSLATSEDLQQKILEKNAQLESLSQTDDLTNLYNRRVLERELSRELRRSQRYGGEFSLMMLDVDHFKALNDTEGHAVGDQALINIAKLIQREARNTDFCIRYGGDEFMILMSNTNAAQALKIGSRVRLSVERHKADLSNLTVSIGIAHIDSFELDSEQVLCLADKSLYAAKEQGKNRVVIMNSSENN